MFDRFSNLPVSGAAAGSLVGVWVFTKLLGIGLDEEEREQEAEEILVVYFRLRDAGLRPRVSSSFGPEGDRWRVETTTTS